ncbi:EcKinase, DUF1679, and/or APH domain containing protein, partial [Asbolus verrucosus]
MTDQNQIVDFSDGLDSEELAEAVNNGEGYLAQFFMITIRDTTDDKQLDIALKAAFKDDKIREMVPIRLSFENEVYFYSKVYPLFKRLERDHGVSEDVEFIPKCLKVSMEEKSEMLALENLKVSKFEIFDKMCFLDHEHIGFIFKTYGRFHAYSYALYDQQPEEYENLVGRFYNVYAKFISDKNGFFKKYLRESVNVIKQYLIPGEDDEIINKFQKYENDGINRILHEIVTEECDYSSILHGDCWSNNMMFKYEKTEGGKKLTDMRLLDWQLIKVGSPVCDLSYCLYSGTSKDIFNNLNHYWEIYYESFSSFLKKLGSVPEKLFPFETFKEQWKKYAKFGMIMALGILRVKMTDESDVIDFSDGFSSEELNTALMNAKFDENRYKNTIKELLQGINNYIITEVKTNQKGEGYLGDIFMITVKDADSDKHLDVIIKAAFMDEKVRGKVPVGTSFQNEINFYLNVYPKFKKFEKERGVSQTVQLVPKCLMVYEEEKEEMLALENLKVLGFEIFDKKAVLDDAHVELIFKTYGRFHAYSFALHDQQPEEYSRVVAGLHNVYEEFTRQSFFGDHLQEMSKLAAKSLIPGEDDEVIKKFEKYTGRNIVDIFKDISVENCDYSAILHGDCWSNNMLFRYQDEGHGKKPTDIRLIDWQMIKVGSPVCDLSYCLYSGASKKVFDNLNEYLKVYYDSFSSF